MSAPSRALATLLAGAGLLPAQGKPFDLAARKAAHWAWQPLAAASPAPADPDRAIDALLGERIAAAGLAPAPEAPPGVLLRRLWIDLVGLPPSAESAARFLADPSPAAYDREVDALLASPQFGERWARHWLDLVRYAETLGHEYDFPIPNAWRYRDYVIRAFNADVPYDQFVREHLAGDLLPEPRRNAAGDDESVQATAAWWFAEQTHSPVDPVQHSADRIDNQLDVLGKALLGLTIACARCHDHKFDAIAQADYYAMYGFAKSSRYVQAPIHAQDVHGAPFDRALAAQRAVAAAWAEAGARGTPQWLAPRTTPPERWSGSGGVGPLRAGDRVIASTDDPAAWIVTNDGFGAEPWRGPWCPDPTAEPAALHLLPGAFWNTGPAGRHREGNLQTQTFRLDQRYLHVRAAGRNSRVVVVVDGFQVVRDPIYGGLHQRVDRPYAHWLTFDVGQWRDHPAYVQCIDQVAGDLADPDHEGDSSYPDDGWLAVQAIVASDERGPPPADPGLALPYRPWTATPGGVREALQGLAAAQDALPVSPTLPALCDGTGADEHLFVRGNHKTPGQLQPRKFLTALAGAEPMAIPRGSGRLQLADALLAPDNPLPARTLVNRVWHYLFGRGLSRTVDNLGVLGDAPANPELLDWLARDFAAHGWSIKHTIRRVVRSHAYRQDSRASARGTEVDPDNLLLARQNVRRLDAEAVRDSLLALGGRLEDALYGPSEPIALAAVEHARGEPERSGPVDGDGRRSIYLAIRRNFMPPMLQAFDLPTPFATIGARSVSNVPAQALTLLNDPLVHAMCARWAERLAGAAAADQDQRLDAAYRAAFLRTPRADERASCAEFLRSTATDLGVGIDDAGPWTDLLHCLVNTKEFTYCR
ncbi:MAG: DUF1549 and DUF1553 domain-containing protein [Planctomycetota bacterium]